jgi:ferric-dicitrate binding protein FerR (iron transport regulator)
MIRKYIPLLAAVCLIALGWVIYVYVRPAQWNHPVHTPAAKAIITSSGDSTRYSSGPSDRAHAVLPDGTGVILNPNTEVTIPKTFTDTVRNIRVNGDAYFVIASKPGMPFALSTQCLSLIVDGTDASFRVSAFDKDQGESVEVLEGTVSASKSYPSQDHNPEILIGGDMVMINRSIDLMEKETFDSATLRAWYEDRLVFQNASIDTVIRQLQDWFGITVNVSGNADNVPNVSKRFHNAGLEEVLSTLSETYHCRYRIGKYTAELEF